MREFPVGFECVQTILYDMGKQLGRPVSALALGYMDVSSGAVFCIDMLDEYYEEEAGKRRIELSPGCYSGVNIYCGGHPENYARNEFTLLLADGCECLRWKYHRRCLTSSATFGALNAHGLKIYQKLRESEEQQGDIEVNNPIGDITDYTSFFGRPDEYMGIIRHFDGMGFHINASEGSVGIVTGCAQDGFVHLGYNREDEVVAVLVDWYDFFQHS